MVNKHVAGLKKLEATVDARCLWLDKRRDTIRQRTNFNRWPRKTAAT